MMRLNNETFPEFEQWLTIRRVLSLAVTETPTALVQLAIGDTDGTSWTLDPNDYERTTRFLNTVEASGRKVWTADGGTHAIRFSKRYGIPLESLTWLLDADTANNTANPTGLAKHRPIKRSLGAAREAVGLARAMTAVREELRADTLTAVMASVRQEQLWRPAQMRGWRVDVEMLETELAAVEENRARNIEELGIDLTGYGPKAAARIHAWLGEVGIRIVDPKTEELSLSRDLFDDFKPPATSEAEVRWKQFRTARSIYTRFAKLNEVKRAMVNGRVHSHLRVRDTVTGRATSSKPALQNLHRDLRGLLIADPGMTLVSLDFSQMEPWVAGALSKDEALLAALASGDVYFELSKSLFTDAVDTDGSINPVRRGIAKTFLLGIFYGKGPDRFADELGVSVEEATATLAAVWKAYPGLATYRDGLKALHARGEALFTTSGRPSPKPSKGAHASLNGLVQGEAADIFIDAVARVAAVVGADALFLGVHDELILQVPSNQSQLAMDVLNAEMPSEFHGVHLPGEAQILGRAWRK